MFLFKEAKLNQVSHDRSCNYSQILQRIKNQASHFMDESQVLNTAYSLWPNFIG